MSALRFGLDQGFLDFDDLFVEGFAGVGYSFGARIIFQALVDGIDLIAKIADLIYGVVGSVYVLPKTVKRTWYLPGSALGPSVLPPHRGACGTLLAPSY